MIDALTDAVLLERFAQSHEDEAFAILMRRHGPRVERVCRGILRDERDVEDAIQAVFLVLASKAGRIRWRDSAGAWLAAVARRIAMAARCDSARIRAREASISTLAGQSPTGTFPERFHPTTDPSPALELQELHEVVERSLDRLPDKYRAIVRLCDLEGKTHDEAARGLGWPKGTTSRRLDRARALLRSELRRHGVTLLIGMGIVAASLAPATHSPSVRTTPAWVTGLGAGATPNHAATGRVLAQFNHDPSNPAVVQELASDAARAANRLKLPDRGDHWLASAFELGDAAGALARANPLTSPQTTLAAGRRLESACIRCHLACRD